MLTKEPDPMGLKCSSTGDWWALYTKHQHEKTVAEILEAKGCEVFLPLYEVVRRWKDRRMTLSLPLFPCYLFMRTNPAHRLRAITTPGVLMIVRCGDQSAVVSSEEILALQRAVRGPGRLEPHPFLKCGERVRVTRGALEGLEGILVRKKNLCRLVLSVDLLARSAAVEVDSADVVAVRTPSTRQYSTPELALANSIGREQRLAVSRF